MLVCSNLYWLYLQYILALGLHCCRSQPNVVMCMLLMYCHVLHHCHGLEEITFLSSEYKFYGELTINPRDTCHLDEWFNQYKWTVYNKSFQRTQRICETIFFNPNKLNAESELNITVGALNLIFLLIISVHVQMHFIS